MENEVYSNRLPKEAVRVISEDDPGFEMILQTCKVKFKRKFKTLLRLWL